MATTACRVDRLEYSALVALIADEPEATLFSQLIAAADRVLLAAPTKLELLIVISGRYGPKEIDRASSLLMEIGAQIVPFTDDLTNAAVAAHLRFGKGRGHPAQLSFGDCMAYALARSLDAPLLFKGDDFTRTDVRVAAIDPR